jgi:hypothetical protein
VLVYYALTGLNGDGFHLITGLHPVLVYYALSGLGLHPVLVYLALSGLFFL